MAPGRLADAIRPARFGGLAAAALAAAVLWVAPASAEPIAVVSRAIPLNEYDPGELAVGVLQYRGGIELSSDHRDFGGLSGLRVSADGSILHAVTDRGMFLTARLSYDADGTLQALTGADLSPLPGTQGTRRDGDAEALTEDGSGGWIVALEQRHRLLRFRQGQPAAQQISGPVGLDALPGNSGIEALARLPDGRLLLLAEHAADGGARQGWLGGDAGWHRLTYLPAPNFSPTDAVALPSGDVLVVERAFHLVGGWGARIVHVEPAALVPGAAIRGKELALLRPPLSVDNVEGMAASQTAENVRIYLVSDDNFNFLQRTLLLTFDWQGARR